MASRKATAAASAADPETAQADTAPGTVIPMTGRRITRHEFVVECSEPIAHFSESIGNHAMIMRRKMRVPGGRIESVPYITGDSIRHQLRESAAYCTLDAAGLLSDPQLSEGALRLLFNGGMVTGKGDATQVNLDRYRELVALFPPLALFGGCTDNRPVPGQLVVNEGELICRETWHRLPPWALAWLEAQGEATHVPSFREQIEEQQRVRMDPTILPEKIRLLSGGEQVRIQGRLLKSEKAHEEGDSKAAGESKSAMLPRTYERIVVGSLFLMAVEARTYSDLEYDAYLYTLSCALNGLRLGGMSRTGHGLVKFRAGARIHFTQSAGKLESLDGSLDDTSAIAVPVKVGDLFRQHIQSRAEELAAWLRSGVNS